MFCIYKVNPFYNASLDEKRKTGSNRETVINKKSYCTYIIAKHVVFITYTYCVSNIHKYHSQATEYKLLLNIFFETKKINNI